MVLLLILAAGFFYYGLTENVDPTIIKILVAALVIMAIVPVVMTSYMVIGGGSDNNHGHGNGSGSGYGGGGGGGMSSSERRNGMMNK
jgi:uncharacterized membrane protein YgcG